MTEPYGEIPSSGPIHLVAQLFAKLGMADTVQELLLDIQSYSLSDGEPGCLEYRLVRSAVPDADGVIKFSLFEQYQDKDAVNAHFASAKFVAFATRIPELLVSSPIIEYFHECKQ